MHRSDRALADTERAAARKAAVAMAINLRVHEAHWLGRAQAATLHSVASSTSKRRQEKAGCGLSV